MTSQPCSCKSYNNPQPHQTTEEQILTYPFTGKKVCIDACIANTISTLWNKGIRTGGSCCGHNHDNPSVILEQDNATEDIVLAALQAIRDSGDLRDWDILSWTMTIQQWHCPKPLKGELRLLNIGAYRPTRLQPAKSYDTVENNKRSH